MLSINQNITALTSQRHLNVNQQNLQKTMERLSSGLQINRAADDAAGMAIARKLETQVQGIGQALANIDEGIHFVKTADGGLGNITSILQRMRELVIQAANDTYTADDRKKIQEEINQLKLEASSTPEKTEFNGKKPLQIPPDRLKALLTVPGKADITFIFDGGGSIAPYVANIQTNLNAFINNLTGSNVLPQISVVASAFSGAGPVRDNADATTRVLDTTGNVATAQAAIAAFPNIGGTSQDTFSSLIEVTAGDAIYAGVPQNEPDRITRTMGSGGVPVQHFIILVTDHGPEQQRGMFTGFAPAGGPFEAGYSVARETAVANFMATQGATVFVIAENTAQTIASYDGITGATGGAIFNVNSPTFGQNLQTIANQIAATSLAVEGKLVNDKGAIQIQVGVNEGDLIGIDQYHIDDFFLGVSGIDVTKTPSSTATTHQPFDDALKKIDAALEAVSTVRTYYGAKQNSMEASRTRLLVSLETTQSSQSRIQDADYAKETAELTRANILVQAGIAILSQANVAPQRALTLLQR